MLKYLRSIKNSRNYAPKIKTY